MTLSAVLALLQRRWKLVAAAGIAAAVLGVFLATYHAGMQRQAAKDVAVIRAVRLTAENAIARADSTRHVLHDSVDVAYRRVQQLELGSQKLTDSLSLETVATASVVVQVTPLNVELASAGSADSTGDRRAAFHAENSPVTVDVDVVVNDSIHASIRASLAPITVDIAAGCTPARHGEISSGYLTASSPDIAQLSVGQVTFDPNVCNPVPTAARRFSDRVSAGVPWGVAGIALTAVLITVF